MDTNKPIFFIFLISLSNFSFFTQISTSQVCPNSVCRPTEPTVRFPFHLHNHHPPSCGHPGFDLHCNAFNRTLVTLPNSGEFTVRSIDYAAQNIWLNDPHNCLPRRLLTLNLSGSPFAAYFSQDFTIFNCTFDYRKYQFDPVACLSGENYTVFASSEERAIKFLALRCSVVATVAVPVQWSFFQPVLTSDLDGDMRLAWGSPRCGRCEARGGRCGLRGVNSSVIECKNPHHHLPKAARYAIIATAGLPSFLGLIGMLYFLCSRRFTGRRHHHFSGVVTPQPAATTTAITGLDDPTIESYPKTILGESRRLPKPDDNICAICLSEYMPKETLRSIPDCRHCFHAECIDEWLRLNSSCPVCRNSPEYSPSSLIS